MTTFWVVVLLVLTGANISVVLWTTHRIITAIQLSVEADRSRVVYESEEFGTVTAYKMDAIVEFLDGTTVVVPKMDEATID